MNKQINVMLIEDHPEYREGIQLALEGAPGITLTSEYGSAERALRILENQTLKKPDIILLDLNLPSMSGLEALPWLKRCCPASKVIILTQSDSERDVLCGIRQGASGYLLKSSTVAQIIEAIRDVSAGECILAGQVAKYILQTFQSSHPEERIEKDLSAREREVLTLLAEGLVKKEIAHQLKISLTGLRRQNRQPLPARPPSSAKPRKKAGIHTATRA